MRILLPTYQMLHGGGIATVVRGLVPALQATAQLGDEAVIVAPHVGPRSSLRGIGRARGGLARLVYEQVRLPMLARRAHSLHLFDARAPLAAPVPFVLTVHDVSFLDSPQWFSPGAARYKQLMLAAALARRPAAVVCDSHTTRERLLHHHPSLARRVRVEVIYPGVTAPPPIAAPPAGGDPYFLSVGALEPRKNHLGLLRAYEAARAEGFALTWKVVGADGHCASSITPALSAAEGVEVLGSVSAERLESLYAGARFLAAPSLLEGFGYPPLEAMQRGIPVVASAGGVFDETLGDAALRVDPTDVSAWADALVRMDRDEALRERLSASGRLRPLEFPWQEAGKRVWSLHLDAVYRG